MKRYIKCTDSCETFDITVIFDVSRLVDSDIMSADDMGGILPIHDIDGVAYTHYVDFLMNVYLTLIDYFKVVEYEKSDKSYTSRYMWLYSKYDGKIAAKLLLRYRISDHPYKETHNKDAEQKWANNKAQQLKPPTKTQNQRVKIDGIVVNKDTFRTYDEALDAIEDWAIQKSAELAKKGGYYDDWVVEHEFDEDNP